MTPKEDQQPMTTREELVEMTSLNDKIQAAILAALGCTTIDYRKLDRAASQIARFVSNAINENHPRAKLKQADTAFTPGPWFVSETLAIGPAGQIIACVRTDCPQANTNANLIAAAPAMFDYIAKKAAEGDEDARALLAEYSITKRTTEG